MVETFRVNYPYTDCKLFRSGETVYYRKSSTGLIFWHPKDKTWQPSIRPYVMRDSSHIECFLGDPPKGDLGGKEI